MNLYRSDEERLTDILIGDAVLQLLATDSVSDSALLNKLNDMASYECDPSRQHALQRAIVEVQKSIETFSRHAIILKDMDNVGHVFRNRDKTRHDTQH